VVGLLTTPALHLIVAVRASSQVQLLWISYLNPVQSYLSEERFFLLEP